MRRHASADLMARYSADDLRPRRAARIAAHLEDCAACRELLAELQGVSSLLATVTFAAMPSGLSGQIEAAIVTESAQRVASEPAAEAGRLDLPVRAQRSRHLNLRLPSISRGALRTVAVTAAAVVVVGGAYELASQGAGSSSGTAAASRPLPGAHGAPAASNGRLSFGPNVTVPSGGHEVSMRIAKSGTNFMPRHLQAEVTSAVTAAGPVIDANKKLATSTPAASASGLNAPGEDQVALKDLAGCIGRVAGGRVLELVELAKFENKPATIIVLAAVASHPAEVLVVGAGCSSAASDLLDHLLLKHI